jgi:hypothetical protein
VAEDDLRVLRSQRNEVFALVTAAGLDPREFRWEHVPSSRSARTQVDRLLHVPSAFFYEFDNLEGTNPNKHYATHSPGESVHTQEQYPGSWGYQLAFVENWLTYLNRELEAPPLWEQIAQGEPLLQAQLEGTEDTPFTPAELAAIESKLDEVREYLRRELPPGAVAAALAHVDRLEGAAKSTGRMSWAQMAIGIVVSLVWGGAMAPDQARLVLEMIGQAFQRLITSPLI